MTLNIVSDDLISLATFFATSGRACGYFGPGGAPLCEFMHKHLGKRGKIGFQFATSLGSE